MNTSDQSYILTSLILNRKDVRSVTAQLYYVRLMQHMSDDVFRVTGKLLTQAAHPMEKPIALST